MVKERWTENMNGKWERRKEQRRKAGISNVEYYF